MTRQHRQPHRGGSRAARAAWLATALLALAAAPPLHAQAASRFSPRVPANGTDAPGGPSLAIYAGIAHGYRGESGTGYGVQLEIGHAGGAVRGLVGFMYGAGAGGLEGGLVVQPDRELPLAPYVAFTAFARDIFEGESGGVAFHVGTELSRSRELALRLEGRAYLSDQTALAALIGIAFR